MILRTAADDEAEGLVAELYAEDRAALGYVPSHTRAMAINPEAQRAFEHLAGAIAGGMDKRRYELVTLAAARAIRSGSCLLAHGLKSLRYIDEDELVAIAEDYHRAGLDETEVAIMEFAERVSGDSASMTDADTQRLRDLGLTDREIHDVALAAAMRNFYSRALQALAVEVDVPPALPVPLRDALLRGI